LDFSQEMLKEAEKILSKYKGRYEVNIGDFFKKRFPLQKYNAVISSFAIHHGRTRTSYLNLYKKIFRSLKKRGVFVCADVLEGDNMVISRINETGWINHMLKHYEKSKVEAIMESYKKEDTPVSVDTHFDLLKKAGFSSCDILWKKHNFGIYTAFK
jgi:tRNA (cmo5U34)-methyltransferase